MAAGAGKIALVTGTATLGCNGGSTACDATQLSRIIDLVGYGNANFFEGAAAGTLSNSTAAIRKTFDFAGQTDLLHDRPPFVLEARVLHIGTPVTVVLNHLRSLIDVESTDPIGSTGLTVGERVREKRRLQAEDLADLVMSRIDENLVVVGDLSAFEFSDGLVDVVGTIEGSPAPADEVTEASFDRWLP